MTKKMTHPDGGKIEVADDQVEAYQSQGWETSASSKPSSTEGDENK